MYAVKLPNTPLFAEHFNPDLKIVELVGCPVSGDSLESEYSFGTYFHGLSKAETQEILESFDKIGYYETFCDHVGIIDGVQRFKRLHEDYYPVTLFPLTDNS
tara:strand:+ start:313 stop:618 length:306 start_codon:yes stop_codon:yes gene_type:complete